MTKREPNLVTSGLSRCVTQGDVTVAVGTFRLGHETTWTLEVVNPEGTSIVWDEQFLTEEAALEEFARTVATEGIETFLDGGKVIPLRR